MGERTPLDEMLEQALVRLRDEPGLHEMLRAARAWGVPPSRLLRQRTVDLVAELDEAGRPVRYLAVPWQLADVALALALGRVEADTCAGCGHRLTETTDPDNEGRYVTDKPVRCHACTALGKGAEPYEQSHQPQALRFPVHLKPPRHQDAPHV